jgi:hypothetical protein
MLLPIECVITNNIDHLRKDHVGHAVNRRATNHKKLTIKSHIQLKQYYK